MKNKKDIINYLVLVGAIIIAFICDTDFLKVFSILFFLSFISLQEVLSFLERKKITDDFKKDVEKQFEAIKRDMTKLNMQLTRIR